MILSLLIFSGGPTLAAGTREERAYAAAVAAFQDGLWSRAETNFNQYIAKYPDATNLSQAVLFLAQSEYKEGAFNSAVALLDQYAPGSGSLADQYTYWKAESQFAAGNVSGAAETFSSVSHKFLHSPLRLTAQVEAAAACAQISDWSRVENLLADTNGMLVLTEQLDPANELVSRGRLLLAQAKFEQGNYAGALAVLSQLQTIALPPVLDWQRLHLFCQAKALANEPEAALAAATNLLQAARLEKNDSHVAESVALQAGLLEKLNRPEEALAIYQLNLTNAAPAEAQQQAVLKITRLATELKQFSQAEQSLDLFLSQFPASPAADIALLTSGELRLKEYLAGSASTNQLAEAQARFSQFLTAFGSHSLAGKAFLDRGWCGWLMHNYAQSLADFQDAAKKLAPSEDQAVARFKSGDAFFALNQFSAARTSYQSVLSDFAGFPEVQKELGGLALYQVVRASLALQDNAVAQTNLEQLLRGSTLDDFAQSSALLLGENIVDPGQAREVFQKLEHQFPTSALRPQVDLAIARTYEQEQNWSAAATNYESWLKSFSTNSLVPQTEFALALANFHAGNETNAFNQFSRFVARYPTNDLAPQAQWWVADYFFRRGDINYLNAETNYELIFQNTNWQASSLVYPAQLMAGRAAMGRLGYKDAIRYFTGLIADSNCPPDLGVQARLAYGAVLMQMPSADTNNPLANYTMATNVFSQITNEFRAQAWGEMGNCALQTGDYVTATNAYSLVFANNSPAGISLRSQAEVAYGQALEKLAAQVSGADQTNLLVLARDAYLDVFYGANLRKDEAAQDSFWTKKAGLQALPLIQALGATNTDLFFTHLEELFPQAREALEKKRAALAPVKG